jgi:uncharacterized membrane protein YeaQ/YmgE (transglycosylase-associated protein family)
LSFLAWIVLGLIAGFIASHLVNHRAEGMVLDILLGIVGAIVGGWIFAMFGAPGVAGVNLYRIVVAVAGAVLSWSSTTRSGAAWWGAGFCSGTGPAGAAASSVA